jgi:hypothetical protein
MAYSKLEDAIVNHYLDVNYPPMEPEEPSTEGMQLAAGPSSTMTDAGPRFGRGGVTSRSSQAAGGLEKPLTGLADLFAGFARGATAQTLGLGGDLEQLYNGFSSVFNRPEDQGRIDAFLKGVQQKTNMATTEQVKKEGFRVPGTDINAPALPPTIPAGVADQKSRQATANVGETFGEFAPLPGAIEAGTAGLKYGLKATKDLPVGMSIKNVGPDIISTRLPTAVKATENPLDQNLIIDLDSAKREPEAFKHNMGLVQQYPNFKSKSRTPDKQADDFINEVKNNLLYLYDKVPADTRARSMLWYDGARNIVDRWGNEYNQPDQALAGVLAVLSPQKDWFMNVSLGQRVLDVMTQKQGYKWDDAMSQKATEIWAKEKYAPMLEAIKGKTLEQIDDPGLKAMWLRTYDQAHIPREHQIVTPEGGFAGVRLTDKGAPYKTGWGSLNEIGKAVVILQDPSKANISANLGGQHKVRSFYNNIYAPYDPSGNVTIDTHAVAAGLLRPLSGNSREVLHNFGSGIKGEGGPANSSVTGAKGTYGLYAEAYRRAAQERDVLPRQMQSVTWEAVRGLFPDTFKTEKNAQAIDNIWLQYRKGKLSLDEARNEVFTAAGGINPPEWERAGLRSQSPQEIQPAVNQGELPGASIPGGSTGGSGRVKPTQGNNPGITGGGQAPVLGAE